MLQNKIKQALKFLLFLSLGLGLFWFVYRKQNPSELLKAFKDVDLFWLSMTILVMFVSHLSRSIRWMMLVEPLGKKVSFWNATLTTFLGYFTNMAFPRLGEVTRCAVLGKYEKIPTSKLLGTVVVERSIDVLMFLFCLLLAVCLQFKAFSELKDKYFALSEKGNEKASYLGIFIIISIILIGLILYKIWGAQLKEKPLFLKIKKILKEVKEGLKTVGKLKNFKGFLFHTFLIWICYYLMMYFGFKVFGFTAQLSPIVALSIFVLGSLGMIVPAPGGIGSFHFFVVGGLVFYMTKENGVEEKAAAFALLIHGVQTLFIMIAGVGSLISLPLINAKTKKCTTH